MADLLISRLRSGVAAVRSVDPFDTLEIYRIDRSSWQATPDKPGVYLLYGTRPDGKLTVYIGMSTSNMRNRISRHHVSPRKNWFGVLFAVPVANPLLCPAIEAELIGEVTEADVVEVVANEADERRHRNVDDVHIEPAVEKIRHGLQLVLGSDIFTATDVTEAETIDAPIRRLPPLAREYRNRAAHPRARGSDDPAGAPHGYVGAGAVAWGSFEGDEPDKRFRVYSGSGWRRPVLDPEMTTHHLQLRVHEIQNGLVARGVLDEATMTFAEDHVFENWNLATQTISGKGQYSGSYHWQQIHDEQ